MKSDLSFSAKIVWNNFPVPEFDQKMRNEVINAGQQILKIRNQYSSQSLADLYNPQTMKPELRNAHKALDKVVDKAFGAPKKLSNDEKRLELLFHNYELLTQKQN